MSQLGSKERRSCFSRRKGCTAAPACGPRAYARLRLGFADPRSRCCLLSFCGLKRLLNNLKLRILKAVLLGTENDASSPLASATAGACGHPNQHDSRKFITVSDGWPFVLIASRQTGEHKIRCLENDRGAKVRASSSRLQQTNWSNALGQQANRMVQIFENVQMIIVTNRVEPTKAMSIRGERHQLQCIPEVREQKGCRSSTQNIEMSNT